jgi:hypothetical protein
MVQSLQRQYLPMQESVASPQELLIEQRQNSKLNLSQVKASLARGGIGTCHPIITPMTRFNNQQISYLGALLAKHLHKAGAWRK